MTTEKRTYSASEWIMVMILAPFAASFITALMVPLMLLSAWMRSMAWNWFAVPYLHLPRVSTGLMFALGLIVSMFHTSSPSLKPEYYSTSPTARLIMAVLIEVIYFVLAWVTHVWFLRG